MESLPAPASIETELPTPPLKTLLTDAKSLASILLM